MRHFFVGLLKTKLIAIVFIGITSFNILFSYFLLKGGICVKEVIIAMSLIQGAALTIYIGSAKKYIFQKISKGMSVSTKSFSNILWFNNLFGYALTINYLLQNKTLGKREFRVF